MNSLFLKAYGKRRAERLLFLFLVVLQDRLPSFEPQVAHALLIVDVEESVAAANSRAQVLQALLRRRDVEEPRRVPCDHGTALCMA